MCVIESCATCGSEEGKRMSRGQHCFDASCDICHRIKAAVEIGIRAGARVSTEDSIGFHIHSTVSRGVLCCYE